MARLLFIAVVGLICAACDEGARSSEAARPDAADALVAPPDASPDGAPSDAAPPDVGPADAAPPDLYRPDAAFWEEVELLELVGDVYADHPEVFARLSRWSTRIADRPRPTPGELGAYGLGNGHVFGFVGYADPLNTVHTLVGPTYEKHDGFFGDYAVHLVVEGAPLVFEAEWAGRSLDAPVAVTGGRAGDLVLQTADFVPWTEHDAARSCFLRIVTVTNTAPEDAPVSVVVSARRPTAPGDPDALVEERDDRLLTTRFLPPAAAEAEGRTLTWTPEPLPPGAVRRATLTHCARRREAQPLPLDTVDADALLRETAAAYADWRADHTRFDLPDPMVADFIEGMAQTLKVQTSAGGATCPMSQYTRTWARDNIGPALGYLAIGAFDDLEAMMDYVYGAILAAGDLRNSYDADLDVDPDAAPPDWSAMAPLSGRVAAETPSYMVWIYGAHYRATGRAARSEARWGFLRRALLAQGFGPGGLLPFTDDETFRAAMNSTLGLDLEHPHAERSWSANSAFLWLGAQKRFAELATALGHPEDVVAADARRAEVEATTVARYRLDDGCFRPFIDREGEVTPDGPFEDVALKVTWAGWLDGEDATAIDSLACLIQRRRVAPGVLLSPLHPRYHGFAPVGGGDDPIYTGMLPGYTLSALTAIGHPEAQAAFVALGVRASTSGNFQEYMRSDTDTGLQPIYEPIGAVGDYTAKFRPWEGGINLAAVVDYLLGFQPHASQRRLALRPHLPAG